MHTFNESGNYSYYCAIHPHRGGTILVTEGTGSYYEYEPSLRVEINKTVDTIRTEAVYGPGPSHSFVAVCTGGVCLPTAAVFGTDPPALLSVSADGGYYPAPGGAMGLDSYKTGSSQYAIVAGCGNDSIQIMDVSNRMIPVSAGCIYETAARTLP